MGALQLRRHRAAALALAVALWGGITALSVTGEGLAVLVLSLYLAPTVIVAVAFGSRIGLAAGLASAVLYLASDQLELVVSGVAGDIALICAYALGGAVAGSLADARDRQLRSLIAAREQIAELRRSLTRLVSQLLEAEDRERERIAQRLHDGTLQSLLVANQDLIEASPGDEKVERVQQVVAEVIGEMRSAVSELHPATMSHGDLSASLDATAERAGELGRFEVAVDVDPRAAGIHDALLVSVARELLTNAARHARATSVAAWVGIEGSSVVLTVIDDGVGMPVSGPRAALRSDHVGLASISERVKAVGGMIEATAPPGGGTQVRVELPMELSDLTERAASRT